MLIKEKYQRVGRKEGMLDRGGRDGIRNEERKWGKGNDCGRSKTKNERELITGGRQVRKMAGGMNG